MSADASSEHCCWNPRRVLLTAIEKSLIAAETFQAPNHSSRFLVDEDALVTGVRAMASLAVDYLIAGQPASVEIDR